MLLDLEQADKGLNGQMVEIVASLAIVCQFLCTAAVNSLLMSEKVVTTGRMFFSFCGVRWITSYCGCRSKLFLCF